MKTVLKAAVFAVGLATLASAQAQMGPYVGASISRVEIDHADLTSLGYKLGYQANQNFAVEARLGTGLFDDSVDHRTYEIDNYAGLYAKAILPLNHNFSVYGLVGYSRAELKTYTRYGMVNDWSDRDVSSGLGLDIGIERNLSINLEWINLVEDVDLLSFGINYGF
ncbi:outer membrane beta-barrel protein [Pseudomonas sp. B392_1p]|uniref:outer membrane beta-barrel protein n=1 Tax=Pseudomonas sp. B392_1p TaxID=3457507 RepID=UPI003FD1FDCD